MKTLVWFSAQTGIRWGEKRVVTKEVRLYLRGRAHGKGSDRTELPKLYRSYGGGRRGEGGTLVRL